MLVLSRMQLLARPADGRCLPLSASYKRRRTHPQASAKEMLESGSAFEEEVLGINKVQLLAQILDAVPGLGPQSRVLDVGSGTGGTEDLIPLLRARGVQDILAVDISEKTLEALQELHGPLGGVCGNEPGLRLWLGDVESVPAYMGPFDAAVFDSLVPRSNLLKTTFLMRPGGYIVINNLVKTVEGGTALRPGEYRNSTRNLVRDVITSGMPLRIAADELLGLNAAVLQVPPAYVLDGGPWRLEGPVIEGFGRGSREMGTPTANIPPESLAGVLGGLPLQLGVYFGWGRVDMEKGAPPEDSHVHKMVLNIGHRPTMGDGAGISVEAHLLHHFSQDFYGRRLRLVVSGYLRPELKFKGLPELMQRIQTDVGLATAQLNLEPHASLANDPFLV